jgi:hypothetical protein
MLSQIYAWKVESNTLPKPISRVKSARDVQPGPAVPRGATSLSVHLETPQLNAKFAETRE